MSKKLATHLVGAVRKSPVGTPIIKPSPLALADSAKMLIEAHENYKKTVQIETTKREAIQAWREVQVKKLSDKRELLETYLSQHFSERRYVIEEMFTRLDRGIDENNDLLIKESLNSIVSVVRQSPLADVDKLMADVSNPDVPYIDI